MRTLHRSLALVGAVALASSLVACGESNQATPTEVIKQYVAALNDGDFESALALVEEPGEVTAEEILKIDGIDIQEPMAIDTEFGEDEEALDLQYEVGGSEVSVGFIKGDDGWKVREPEFLIDTHMALDDSEDGSVMTGLVNSESKITTADGADIMEQHYVVVMGKHEIPLSISFPGNEFVESQEMIGIGKFFEPSSADGHYEPWFRANIDQSGQPLDWVITDSFYEELETYALSQPPHESSQHETSFVAFAAKDQCEIQHVGVLGADKSFSVDCVGGTQRTTYTETYRTADGMITEGDVSDEVGHFGFDIEDGEIVDL